MCRSSGYSLPITILLIAFLVAYPATTASGQMPRDCGDVEAAKFELQHVLLYFTGDGPYEYIRDGRWDKLDSEVDHRVMTVRRDCRILIDEANPLIVQEFPSSSMFRTADLVHFIYEIGPYLVLIFFPENMFGRAPMWIFDRDTLKFLWEQGV